MKLYFEVNTAQKKKILEILKLSDVAETVEPEITLAAPAVELAASTAPAPAEPDVTETAPPVEPDAVLKADADAALAQAVAEGVIEPSGVTKEEVAAAVLARAKRTTSAQAIVLIEKYGGSSQLKNVEPQHFPALLKALQAEPVEE